MTDKTPKKKARVSEEENRLVFCTQVKQRKRKPYTYMYPSHGTKMLPTGRVKEDFESERTQKNSEFLVRTQRKNLRSYLRQKYIYI